MGPRISVIVPFYNPPYERFQKCLQSILCQRFRDFELLLIDDGSREEYADLLTSYIHNDCRIKLLRQENRGVSCARNTGIACAAGEYVCFVDADDYVDPGYLQLMLERMNGNCDIVICGVCEQTFPVIKKQCTRQDFFSHPSQFIGLQYVNFSVNKLYHLSIIKEHDIQFQEGIKQGEDALFLCEYLDYSKAIMMIDDALYHYVVNETSAVHQFDKEFWKWELNVIRCQWELFHQYQLCKAEESFIQEWLYDKIIRVLRCYADQADYETFAAAARCIFSDSLYSELRIGGRRWIKRIVCKTRNTWLIYKLLTRHNQ